MSMDRAETARNMENHEEAQALALIGIGKELKKIREEMEADEK